MMASHLEPIRCEEEVAKQGTSHPVVTEKYLLERLALVWSSTVGVSPTYLEQKYSRIFFSSLLALPNRPSLEVDSNALYRFYFVEILLWLAVNIRQFVS